MAGLRIRVRDVLVLLASGGSPEEILDDYPTRQRDHDDWSIAPSRRRHRISEAIFVDAVRR